MQTPLVVDYLRTHSVSDLMAEHGVRLSPSRTRPYKASLNYDQIAARNDDALACQCRGLVLATRDGSPIPVDGPCGDLQVLAWPMDRFFNHGQGAAHAVTDELLAHPDTRIYEKLDGTLCVVYFDHGALLEPGVARRDYEGWCVATRSVPDADLPVDGFADATFRSLFEAAATRQYSVTWSEFCTWLDPDVTYCFELTSPRAGSGVVRYTNDHTWLLAARRKDGAELAVEQVNDELALSCAPSHPTCALDEVLAMIEARSPAEAEGVVLRLPGRDDAGGFRRVKVKSAAYVAAHGISSEAGASPRNLLRIILRGLWDDVGPMTRPHLREKGDAYVQAIAVWAAKIDAEYVKRRAEHGDDRRAFALSVQATDMPIGPFMAQWTKQVSSTAAWLQSRRDRTGEWSDGFLDQLASWLPE